MSGWARAAVAAIAGALGTGLWLWGAPPVPQLLGVPLVTFGLFWASLPPPEPLRRAWERLARRPALRWGVPMLALAALVLAAYHPLLAGFMPWAAGQADHPTHQYQAWLLVEQMLPSGRLSGWSDLRWAGYPALELYPMGGPLWVALFRALTLGQLDWEATYALALAAMVVVNVWATYVAARRLSGPGAALIAALLVLFERGWPRQGGDHYAIDVGVWPVTMGVGPLLLGLERQWSFLTGRAGVRALVAACLLAGWALLCHPMYLPVAVLAALCVLLASWGRAPVDRAMAAAALPLVVGLMLAAFWYLPFMVHSGLSEPGGAPFRSLSNTAEGLVMASFAPNFWTPALVAAMLGALLALGRGGGAMLVALLSLALILATSSTPLELSRSLTELSASVQQERFMIPLRLLLCILAGHAIAAAVAAALGDLRRWSFRRRLAGAALAALSMLLVAPAIEGFVKHQVVPILEFDNGPELDHRRDLHALCRWLAPRAQVPPGTPPPRTAWYVGYGHHEYNNAPIWCGVAQIIDSPAETFDVRPGGISEREVRAFGVRWVIGDRPIEGRDDYLRLVRRFGDLHVYEVEGADPADRVTVLGPGRARIEHFEDELIRIRVEGAGEDTRLAVHVARHPRWEATIDGRSIPVAGGHLGLPRADLIHLPVTDGVVELRYRRGPAVLIGVLLTFLAAVGLGLLALVGRRPALGRLLLARRPLSWIADRSRPVKAVITAAAALGVLAAIVIAGSQGGDRPPDERSPVEPGDEALADHLDGVTATLVTSNDQGERVERPLERRWDGRLGRSIPPEVIVDRHVEALELGDPRRVVAVRVGEGEVVRLLFPLRGVRGVRGAIARGGRGPSVTRLEVRLDGRPAGEVRLERLGQWERFELAAERPGAELELEVSVEGAAGRAVLIDAELLR